MTAPPGPQGRPAPVLDWSTPEGEARVLELLRTGDVTLKGRITWSSNATFVVSVGAGDGLGALAIYKPVRGERPLWDFPAGLWKREVAAYHLARELGWDMVPPTVGRGDGPLGAGSLQLVIDADTSEHYFTLVEQAEHQSALKRVAAFDVVANNADRKGGHCLLGPQGRIWAIDNGLCFHSEPKLRTVIWEFAGERVPREFLEALEPLAEGTVPPTVRDLLSPEEAEALVARAAALRRKSKYPAPRSDFHYPWPLI